MTVVQLVARRSEALSPTLRGMLWMTLCGLCFAVMNATTRLLTADLQPYVFAGHTASVSATVREVHAWTAETPSRYRLVVELIDPAGRVSEVVTQHIGFRTVLRER